jgi:hypothetical protein
MGKIHVFKIRGFIKTIFDFELKFFEHCFVAFGVQRDPLGKSTTF